MFPPAPGYNSAWKRVGVVEVRVAGVAVTRVPVTDERRLLTESPNRLLTIWVEVRTDAVTRRVELRRWQGPLVQDCRVLVGGIEVPRAILGPGIGLNTGLPFKQTVEPGRSVFDVLVFSVPVNGDLLLSLDAERFDERGTVNLPIPATAWR